MVQITVKISPFGAVLHCGAGPRWLKQRLLREVFLQEAVTHTYIQYCCVNTNMAA